MPEVADRKRRRAALRGDVIGNTDKRCGERPPWNRACPQSPEIRRQARCRSSSMGPTDTLQRLLQARILLVDVG